MDRTSSWWGMAIILAVVAMPFLSVLIRMRRDARIRSRLPSQAHQLSGPYRRTGGRR